MEGPAVDWKTGEYPSDEGGGKMGWIWSNGVSLGKKILAAGVVVSSAPLVVPPLVAVSTIAMISSVPYCLFLASYACTQKLMSALLPSSSAYYDGGDEDTGGIEKDEYGFEEPVMEENKYGREDFDGEGLTGVDEDEPSPGEADPIMIQIEGEEVTVTDMGEEPTFKVTDRVVAVYERPVVSENEEMEKETKNLIESIRDEGRSDEVHGTTLEKAFQEDEKPIVSSSDDKSEKVGAEVKDLPETEEAHETRDVDEKEETDKQKLDGHEGELESTVTETSTSTGKDEEVTPNEAAAAVYDEEQIWEKIDAVRRIVGYNAAKGATCAEELKALYVFTGVEPPTPMSPSFKDSVDVARISGRLRFLMSVIGIK